MPADFPQYRRRFSLFIRESQYGNPGPEVLIELVGDLKRLVLGQKQQQIRPGYQGLGLFMGNPIGEAHYPGQPQPRYLPLDGDAAEPTAVPRELELQLIRAQAALPY